jgi:P27 family predicted phage terminase small subunit
MRGRKPTPTALKVFRGNPGKRPLNDQEPQPRRGPLTCPQHLDAEAKKEWRRVAKELNALGLLTVIDRATLAAYCQAWSRWLKLESIVQQTGEVLIDVDPVSKKPTGALYSNPYFAALNKTLRTLHQFASEFGMSPSSRTRLSMPRLEGQGDALERFFKHG